MGDDLLRRREDGQAEGELDSEIQRVAFVQESHKMRGEREAERELHRIAFEQTRRGEFRRKDELIGVEFKRTSVAAQIAKDRKQLQEENKRLRNQARNAMEERNRYQEAHGDIEDVHVEPILEENEEPIPVQNDEVELGRGVTVTDEVIREAQNFKGADESDPSSIRYSRVCLNCALENPAERAACMNCGYCICKPCADKRDCPACPSTNAFKKIFENDEGNADKSSSIRYSRCCPICVIENPRQRACFRCGDIVCYSCAVRVGGKCPSCNDELTTGFVKLIEVYVRKKENDVNSERQSMAEANDEK